MSHYGTTDFYLEVAKGNVEKHSILHKFGRNPSVSTTFVPITMGGNYRTPQVSGATTLRVKAGGDANDTAAGTGAREVTLQGVDETGAEIEEAVATAGASASSATSATFLRLFRCFVSSSGSYATQAVPSHADNITIEDGAGTEDWAAITNTDFGRSQSLIGVYTVPLGKTAFIRAINMNVDSTKTCSILLFERGNILETAAPYTAMRLQLEYAGIAGTAFVDFDSPMKFDALTDVGFMGKVDLTSADVSVDFEILLVDD